MLKDISNFIILPFSLLLLSACDDMFVLVNYDKSTVQKKAENGDFNIGDSIYDANNYKKLCLVAPQEDLTLFTKENFSVTFSEEFYLVLIIDKNNNESVSWIHSSWIATPEETSLCVNSPNKIMIYDINNDELIVGEEV